jgi:hypothetical protein
MSVCLVRTEDQTACLIVDTSEGLDPGRTLTSPWLRRNPRRIGAEPRSAIASCQVKASLGIRFTKRLFARRFGGRPTAGISPEPQRWSGRAHRRSCSARAGRRSRCDVVMTAAQILHEGMPGGGDLRGPVALEATHGPEPGLQPSVSVSAGLFAYCSTMCRAEGTI